MVLADVLLEGGEEGGEKVAEVAVVDLLVVHHGHVVVGFGPQHGEVLGSKQKNEDIMCGEIRYHFLIMSIFM
jgi:hypothetical protein